MPATLSRLVVPSPPRATLNVIRSTRSWRLMKATHQKIASTTQTPSHLAHFGDQRGDVDDDAEDDGVEQLRDERAEQPLSPSDEPAPAGLAECGHEEHEGREEEEEKRERRERDEPEADPAEQEQRAEQARDDDDEEREALSGRLALHHLDPRPGDSVAVVLPALIELVARLAVGREREPQVRDGRCLDRVVPQLSGVVVVLGVCGRLG